MSYCLLCRVQKNNKFQYALNQISGFYPIELKEEVEFS